MIKILLLFIWIFSSMALAASVDYVQHIDRKKAKHVKRVHHTDKNQHHSAKERTFRTSHEFRNRKRRDHKSRKHRKHIRSIVRGRSYEAERPVYRHHRGYVNTMRYRKHSQIRGFRHYQNSWYLAYKYDRASFYDNEGFYYGYFNRRGYTFEGEFYRYDRYYTYHDRVRGRGLFTPRYFRPTMEYYSYYRTN